MSRHLILVTLGPVQEFIAQARRTRDLWFGSHLLSELSRAAATAMSQARVELVFPALDAGDPELEPCDGPLRPDGKPPLAIPNKVLAVAEGAIDPERAARGARDAAQRRWLDLASRVRGRCAGLLARGVDEAWDEQIKTFIELYAAWTPIAEGHEGYPRARDELEAAVAGRKLLRDFPGWRKQRGSVFKSSLDGGRETVLAEPDARAQSLVRRYRIARGEELDAVGLVKRAGGEPEQFVPIPNIALAPWIEAARRVAPKEMETLAWACEEKGISPVARRDLRCGVNFSYEAQVFIKSRWSSLLQGDEGNPPANTARDKTHDADTARAWGESWVRPILRRMRAPTPYVACLVADGDRMRSALEGVHDIESHRRFSKTLSYFAVRARQIVEQDHRGILVYAGGDDVLGFVCVEDAVRCADELRKAFAGVIDQVKPPAGGLSAQRPTLSVGIGVGHFLESLGELRRIGRDANERAKKPASRVEGVDRNALAILVEKRSGGREMWRASWDERPVNRLEADAALLEGARLSMKKVFEVRATLRRLPEPGTLISGEQRSWAKLLVSDTARTLAHAGDGEGLTLRDVGLRLDERAGYDALRGEIDRWISRMLIAHVLSDARRASIPKDRPDQDDTAETPRDIEGA